MRRSGAAWRAFLGLSVLVAIAGSAAAQAVEVTYIANEGFLIARGGRKVLVDALFPGIRHYPVPPSELREAMTAGEAPFDGVDLVLATHFHDDHFGAAEVGEFLARQPEAVFISTPQAVEKLGRRDDGETWVRAVLPAEGEREILEVAGIELTVLNLHHGRSRPRPTQNLGFLIDFGGFRVLHVGDTEVSAEEIRSLALGEVEIDLALLPDWLLCEPAWDGSVEAIGPAAIVAMHVATPTAPESWFGSAGSREARLERLRENFPDIWVATEPMESRIYESAAG